MAGALARISAAAAAALAISSCGGGGGASTTPAPRVPAGQLFGFNDAGAMLRGQTPPDTAMRLAATAGANTVRITFDWRGAERRPGELRLDGYDAAYRAAVARGIRPIFTILFAPWWTWEPGVACQQFSQDCKYPPGPTHDDAWREIVTTLVRRYPKMAALEVWNEPNLRFFWQSGPDPERYAALVTSAKAAVTAADSAVPVLGGSMSPVQGTTAQGIDAGAFLERALAAGMAGHVDGIALHPYPGDVDDARFHKQLVEARAALAAHHDDSELWVTELGASSTDRFTELTQAAVLSRLRAKLGRMRDVRAVILHTMVEPSKFQPYDPEYGYGLLHPDLSPKPAWCALGGGAARTPGCTITGPPTLARAQQQRWAAQDLLERAIDAAQAIQRRSGRFSGVSAAALHAVDPAISPQAQTRTATPGPRADPSRIFVFVNPKRPQLIALCNVSRSRLSYCALTRDGRAWTYESAPAGIQGAAGRAAAARRSTW